MKINKNIFFTFIISLFVFIYCKTVPITGRSQISLIPESQLNSMSESEYRKFLSSHKTSTDETKTAMIKRTGQKIRLAVEKYLNQNGLSGYTTGYRWEFNLVEDKMVNAWCMPGGKVVFYTGILPIAETETGIAVVMGHEVAHAIANHGNERMSQGLLLQTGGLALGVALRNKSKATQALFMGAFGAGAQVGVMLPFSRSNESEADRMGLIFMAMAGYNQVRRPNSGNECQRHQVEKNHQSF